jgi:hypothetical protein
MASTFQARFYQSGRARSHNRQSRHGEKLMSGRAQPRPGDVLLGCAHRPSPYAGHIYSIPNGLPFRRPNRTAATAKWIVLCGDCQRRYVLLGGGSATDAPIACDYTWEKDDEPIQYRKPS